MVANEAKSFKQPFRGKPNISRLQAGLRCQYKVLKPENRMSVSAMRSCCTFKSIGIPRNNYSNDPTDSFGDGKVRLKRAKICDTSLSKNRGLKLRKLLHSRRISRIKQQVMLCYLRKLNCGTEKTQRPFEDPKEEEMAGSFENSPIT